MNIESSVEILLSYAVKNNLTKPRDIIYTRNLLYDLLQIKLPEQAKIPDDIPNCASEVLKPLLDYCAENKLIYPDTPTTRDLMDARIMGILLPKPSEIEDTFYKIYKESKKSAAEYFYSQSKASNYIQTERIAKNILWTTPTEYGDFEISINLSKPEKDPRDIAAAKFLPQSNYPKCLLCPQNEGYSGSINQPARQNIRLIKVNLAGEQWFFQYSPYVYYEEHCIILCPDHLPMKMTKMTFVRMLEFLSFLPHYFIGTNADLPIVGGSILTHDHYQGGRHEFPMDRAHAFTELFSDKGYKAKLLKWPLSAIRISGTDKKPLIEQSMEIMNAWREYTDSEADIISYSPDGTPHNAITLIARTNSSGEFEFDLVLRNNRTTEKYPLGIFHPHEEWHHIKKENIGLIEVMGLAILPGRLADELEKGKYTKNEIGEVFKNVLNDAGVFKQTEKGNNQFIKFMKTLGYK